MPKPLLSLPTALLALLLQATWLLPAPARAAPPTQLSVTGAVAHPGTLGLTDLQARPAVTQTVTFSNAGVPQTHTYLGTSLWGVLDNAGVLTDPSVKNDLLNKYVLATGSDGYRSVFSLGELSPNFGGRPDLLAYAESVGGVSVPLGSDGFARITAPGDAKGGRYLSNLVDLDVRGSGSTQAGSSGGVATKFSVSGAVLHAASFDLAALKPCRASRRRSPAMPTSA